jgi:hypothetical protein
MQVAMSGVPWDLALEEQHCMTAGTQLTHQTSVGRGMTIAPGGRDRQPNDDDAQL